MYNTDVYERPPSPIPFSETSTAKQGHGGLVPPNPEVEKHATQAVEDIINRYSLQEQNDFVRVFNKGIIFMREEQMNRQSQEMLRTREHYEQLLSNINTKNI